MTCENIGLVLNIIGSVLIGLSSQFGSAAGWGGVLVWKGAYWRWANAIGWLLLVVGFSIQLYAAFQA